MNKLKCTTVFVDIDATLTDTKPEILKAGRGDPFTTLVAKANEVSLEVASENIARAVTEAGNLVDQYYPFGTLDKLGITADQLWRTFTQDFRNTLFMYPDAREFLIGMKERYPEVRVFTATTNPQLIIYAKLAIEGLANQYGSPYLTGAFGGEEVFLGGKLTPEFYTALLARTGAEPDRTLMVGDSPEYDLGLARAAGIEQVVLPRREQNEDWVMEPDGGLYVRRLDLILELMDDAC